MPGPLNNRALNRRAANISIRELHEKDDLDLGESAHHHTLGWAPGQAASGNAVKALIDDLTARVKALEDAE